MSPATRSRARGAPDFGPPPHALATACRLLSPESPRRRGGTAGDGDAADGGGGGVRGAGMRDGGRRCGAPPVGLVVDAFVNVGGNSIQFAARGCYMVVVEIDPRKVELAVHNARIYSVEDRIEFVVGDFFRLAPFLKADLVFFSPPWGGPSYNQMPIYTLDMLKPKDGYAIFQAAQGIAPNIVMFLPWNVDICQVEELTWLSSPPLDFESEENHIQHRFKGITAYFGNTA